MKSFLIILIIAVQILFIGCKSEEQKNETKQLNTQQQVLPPKNEPLQQQTIQKQENIDPKVAAKIIAVIKENLAATAAKDKDRVLKTISKDSPQIRSTISGMDYVFANFDMKFELEKVEVIELNDTEAKVFYVQTTQAIRGEGFAPTRATGIHILKKENGEWKIFKTDYLSNEPI